MAKGAFFYLLKTIGRRTVVRQQLPHTVTLHKPVMQKIALLQCITLQAPTVNVEISFYII
jgi:hypothetical protein